MRWWVAAVVLVAGCGGGTEPSECEAEGTCVTPTDPTPSATGTGTGVTNSTGTGTGVATGAGTGTATGTGTGTATGTGTGTGGTTPCVGQTLWGTLPVDGATDHNHRQTIEVEFDAIVGGESLILTESATGTVIGGSTTFTTDTLVFEPTTPLTPSTAYRADIAFCGTQDTIDFETSDAGPAVDPYALVGRTYEVDLATAQWVEPAGVGALLGTVLSTEIYYSVLSSTGSTVDVLVALGDGAGQQDLCAETIGPITADMTNNPVIEQVEGPGTLALPGIVPLTHQGLYRAAEVNPGTDAFEAGTLQVDQMDMRALDPLTGGTCALMLPFSGPCGPCPDGTLNCKDLDIRRARGGEVFVPVVVRSAGDIAADPSCP